MFRCIHLNKIMFKNENLSKIFSTLKKEIFLINFVLFGFEEMKLIKS